MFAQKSLILCSDVLLFTNTGIINLTRIFSLAPKSLCLLTLVILDSESLSVQKSPLDYYLTRRFPLLTLAYLGRKKLVGLSSTVTGIIEIPSVNIGIFGPKRSVGLSSTDDTSFI